jgi:hypothetical protein
MSVTEEFTVEVQSSEFRVRYAEARRHVVIPVRFTAGDTWLLEPTDIVWWERRDGMREPITIMERNVIVARVLAAARERHHLRMHTPDEIAPPPTDETGAPITEDLSPPDGEDVAAMDPELRHILDGGPTPDATRVRGAGDAMPLVAEIDAALARIQPMADQQWGPAMSIARQLHWCRGALRGEGVETPPGPFSMGLIAVREFDMCGNDPDLASLINRIERAMNDRLRR